MTARLTPSSSFIGASADFRYFYWMKKNAKRKAGRPKIGVRVLMILPSDLIRSIDEFADDNFGMSRPDATRTLLELGLKGDHDDA